ncbi:ABC transporter family substrate-binding protein [Nocardiopsis lambiniae]|uniref:ABC transporter family substrate-binding protein n=1 Tax=Nocardiopsis lambiniae TaxID=3075539 RepID=A0ABU2M4N0_9ACTN|nr:ABC transporter family substrate-binding protein [Nocardiopsis sp. DSM 44743]MDT0327601.1 ABC transporter family substrate-binding protein [Nocardiopsis sp. DSM 44743]
MRTGKARYLAPVVALVITASACGNDDGRSAGEENASLEATDLNPAAREDLREGGRFVWALGEYEEQYNMVHIQGNKGDVRRVMAALMPSITRFRPDGSYEPRKEFVLDYGVSEDGLKVTFELNPDAVWSDGEPVTWEDYEARVLTSKGETEGDLQVGSDEGYKYIDEVVQGDDEFSFTLEFSQPYADWPALFDIVYPEEYMEDEELFEEGYTAGEEFVTAGPFVNPEFDEVTQRITVTRNDDWWGDKALLDEIVFVNVAIDGQATAFNNDEVDGFYLGYDSAGYDLLQGKDGAYFTRAVNHGHRFISVNAGSELLSDKNVRHALAMGIDRDKIANVALSPVDWPITGEVNRLLRSSQHGYQDNSGELGEYDPERAGELLDEAGWTLEDGERFRTNADGETLTIGYVASEDMQLAKDEADITREMLAEIGIEVDVQNVPGNALFSDYIVPGNYELAAFVLTGSNPYASDSAGNFGGPYDEDGEDWGNNLSFHSTQEINDLFEEMGQETDPDRYAELANRIDAAIWEEVLTIPMFERPGQYVLKDDLHNWGEYGLAGDYVYENIGWAKEE